MRPRLLDLFSGAGGCAVGYHQAGFDVTGVDIAPQPRYPFTFVQADALEYVAAHGHEFDAIHASPPCQAYSVTRTIWRGERRHPDLVAATRESLASLGIPYVIENVPGAPLQTSIELCGAMFGLKVYRHRRFESNVLLFQPAHPRHVARTGRAGYDEGEDGWMSVAGHFTNVTAARAAMGIDWMKRDELAQAIPPAFTEYIGKQLRAVLKQEEAA